jgi:hypothetical protein
MKKQIEKIISQPPAPGMVGDGFRVLNYILGAGISRQRISPFLCIRYPIEQSRHPPHQLTGRV